MTYSPISFVAAIRSSAEPSRASSTARCARSAIPTISAAAPASRSPPAVSATPPPDRTTSSSPNSRRSDASAAETAGTDTDSSRAAAVSDPWRATAVKVRSCERVTAHRS
jgi:hypothetical protein